MNIRSIQLRLTVWHTVLITVAAICFGIYTYLSLEHRLYEEIATMMARRIVHLREDITPVIADTSREALASKIEDIYSPEQNDRFIRVSKSDGTVLFVSGAPSEHTFDPALIPMSHDYTRQASEQMKNLRSDQHILLVGLITTIEGSDYVLEMGTAITPVATALHKLLVTLLIGLPIVVLIAIAGGSFLVRRALQPVEAIRATAEQITFGNVSQRVPVAATGDAIENLAKTLNQMLDRLDQAYQQASRFSADASHELRTPLAIMRSELEGMLQGQNLQTSSPRERIGSILEETERLSRIVESLFAVARLDAGEARMAEQVFDLSALLRSTLDQMQLLADDKNLSVTVDAQQLFFVKGDAARLKQIIVNLFDNAIKYTMAGGTVAFAVRSQAAKAILTVKDNGIGIPAESLPHVFERFYRADKVRSGALQGAGLGLSIVRSICQAHGGTVHIQSEEGTGTIVTVELLLAPAPSTQAAA
jgi:heavy metal sensor kinase